MSITTEYDKQRLDLLKYAHDELFHMTPAATVATADATDLTTAMALANSLYGALSTHFADVTDATTGVGAHRKADIATALPTYTTANGSNLSAFVLHLAGTLIDHCQRDGLHLTPDRLTRPPTSFTPSNSVTAVCSNLNAIKAAFNVHALSAFSAAAV